MGFGQDFTNEGGINGLLSKISADCHREAGLKKGIILSNCLEAKLELHRPKVAPQKSLVWESSPWFDSHHLQVRAAGGQEVGGRIFPFWGQGTVVDWDLRREGHRRR